MSKHSQRFLLVATAVYLVLGLGAGLVYRELTKNAGLAAGRPLQLGVLHTHLLTLGFLVGLIVLVLDRVFALGHHRLFPVFFWVYNAGVVLSAAMMAVHGLTELGGGEVTAATAGIAGMGHIALTIGLVLLVVMLGQAVWTAHPQEREQVR
ncbi:DUF2871 domain-containing protein [Microbacterium luticocti]|uniref:DUF2871 domain-containing protein n=1 Tax=Microbacterium luticocti TaxID=451764 RepID=UPI00040A25F0|nr:DUF2871 domain-containing protein [Microbacterium luticocti]